jgi:hypothetical protein
MVGKNRDCLNDDLDSDLDSDFGVGRVSLCQMLVPVLVLPRLLMRKKFLSLVGRWVLESLECFLEEKERPEKFRFSVAMIVARSQECTVFLQLRWTDLYGRRMKIFKPDRLSFDQDRLRMSFFDQQRSRLGRYS